MTLREYPPALARYSVFLLFLFCSLAALIWFGWSIGQLAKQLWLGDAVIIVSKGVIYLLGVGIASMALTVAIFYESLLKHPLTEKLSRWITRIALAGVVLVFLLPQLIHYSVEHNLQQKGYVICQDASTQWLLYRKIVYAAQRELCAEVAEK